MSYNEDNLIYDKKTRTYRASYPFVSKLSNGTDTYTLKDENAYHIGDLATVATSGSYNDLLDKPTINDLTTAEQQAALNSGINTEKTNQITINSENIDNLTEEVSTINSKIPTAATSSNQLADKAFVNSSINSVTANYITSDASGSAFATKADLDSGPYYYGGSSITPSENDYAIVLVDETHENANTRYVYTKSQWSFQYVINSAPFTQSQLDAINSGITSNAVSTYNNHINNEDVHVTTEDKSIWNAKQNAIIGAASTVTENNLTNGRALISNSSGKIAVSDTTSTELSYVHGVTSSIQTQLDNKVDKTISNSKVYATSNTGTQTVLTYSSGNEASTIAQRDANGQLSVNQTPTENTHATSKKYVDDELNLKQDNLVSSVNIKTVNGYSLVGSGNVELDPFPLQTDNSGKFLTTDGTEVSWKKLANVSLSGSYNDLTNKLTAGTDINISDSNVISSTHPEVYITQEEYDQLVSSGSIDPNTYYNTESLATPIPGSMIISIQPSMNVGDALNRGYMVLVANE